MDLDERYSAECIPATPASCASSSPAWPATYVREAVARRPDMPAEVLAGLAGDADVRVREAVASHPAAPLARLADDEDAFVRRAVAYNPSTPPDVLAQLAGDADARVRWDVACRPATSPKVLS